METLLQSEGLEEVHRSERESEEVPEGIDINHEFINSGWQGSAKEPVISWPASAFPEGEKFTVVLGKENHHGHHVYYSQRGDVEIPQRVAHVEWKKVYEIKNGKWEVVG